VSCLPCSLGLLAPTCCYRLASAQSRCGEKLDKFSNCLEFNNYRYSPCRSAQAAFYQCMNARF